MARGGKHTVIETVQTGGNAFHWVMVALTGGLWLLVWPLFRRKRRVTLRYK